MSYETTDMTTQPPAYGFEAQLRKEMAKLTGFGINGLHANKLEKGVEKQDTSTAKSYYNFWMGEQVIQLGCDIERANRIAPVTWACWMSNTEINITGAVVTIRCPNEWRAIELDKKFKKALRDHYKTEHVKFVACESLNRQMKNL